MTSQDCGASAPAFSASIGGARLAQLRALINAGSEAAFYSWTEWTDLRAKVLKLDNFECQICKARGRYRRGQIVHHVKHIQERPDLALSVWDPDTGARQLLTVCKRCHEEQHPEAMRQTAPARAPTTPERWD